MGIKQQIELDLHNFMRSKNEIGRNTLRLVIAAIKMYEIEKAKQVEDAIVLNIIQKEIKIRRDTLVDFAKANRQDLITSTNNEIIVLEKYLPIQLSDPEIEEIVQKAISDLGIVSPSEMGKVMKTVLPLLSGKASADRVSQIVRNNLGN